MDCSDSVDVMPDRSHPTSAALSLLEDRGLASPDFHYKTRLVPVRGQPQRFVAVEMYHDRGLVTQYPFHYFLVDTILKEAYYASYLLDETEFMNLVQEKKEHPVRK